MTIGVGILLGGQSSRMGEPKHLIKIDEEQTLMDFMVSFATTISETVITVGGQYGSLPYVPDQRFETGPLAGVEALLHSRICNRYLILGCDMPYIDNHSVQPLLVSTHSAAFIYEERVYGLPCVIDASCATVCTECLNEGMRSLKDFLRLINCELIPATSELTTSFSSLNSLSDVHHFTLKRGRA